MNLLDDTSLTAKQSIVRAFLKLLGTNNLDSISVKEIVNRAYVNRSTFYLHFQDKYDLMDQLRTYLTTTFLSFYDSPPEQKMFALREKTTIDICEHILIFRSFYQYAFNDPTYIYDLSNALSEKLVNVYRVHSYAVFASYSTIGYLSTWITEEFHRSPIDAAEELMTISKTNWSKYTDSYM